MAYRFFVVGEPPPQNDVLWVRGCVEAWKPLLNPPNRHPEDAPQAGTKDLHRVSDECRMVLLLSSRQGGKADRMQAPFDSDQGRHSSSARLLLRVTFLLFRESSWGRYGRKGSK